LGHCKVSRIARNRSCIEEFESLWKSLIMQYLYLGPSQDVHNDTLTKTFVEICSFIRGGVNKSVTNKQPSWNYANVVLVQFSLLHFVFAFCLILQPWIAILVEICHLHFRLINTPRQFQLDIHFLSLTNKTSRRWNTPH